jgi:NADPH-dependent glutamate synthase beta subunit-like oxidoreductase
MVIARLLLTLATVSFYHSSAFTLSLNRCLDPREFCISTKEFVTDEDGNVKGLNTVRVEWTKDSVGRWKMEEVPGSERFFPAQLVFLALGFLGPESELIKAIGVKTDPRSNIETPKKVSIYGREKVCLQLINVLYRNTLPPFQACSRQVIVDEDNH